MASESVVTKIRNLPGTWKAMLIIQVILFIAAIPVFIDAFLFTIALTGSTLITDIKYLVGLFRDLALAGSISVFIVNSFGAFGTTTKNKTMVVLYIVGCVCCIIILLVCAILPEIVGVVVNVACDSISTQKTTCYKCPDTASDTDCQNGAAIMGANCWYRQSDFNAICIDFRAKINLLVALFYISGILSFVNSILGCVALSQYKTPAAQTQTQTVVVLASPQGYPHQSYPVQPGQPYPPQPYPAQPYPPQPYPQQPGQVYTPYPQAPDQVGQPYPVQPGQPYPPQPYQAQPYPQQPGQPQQHLSVQSTSEVPPAYNP